MNAALLLKHYARIADAPDAIARLRRFVLDLAVRGKLVAQEGTWQTLPIESCLEKLPDGRFIHQGWSPQCEAEPSTDPMVWGVLKTTSVQDGLFLPDHNKRLPSKLDPKVKLTVNQDDILMTCAGPRARCGVPCLVGEVRERLIFSGKMYRFRAQQALIASEYLVLFLRSADTQAAIDAMKTGSSESGMNLTQDRFRTLHVTFGSLDEQRKIITTVNELMALCDQLEAARAEREAARDTFTLSTFAKLNTPDPETFGQDARFALANLAPLTTRPDQIKQLRQTILNLAVRGKLVGQDAADEPAAEQIHRIGKAKSASQKAKQATRDGKRPDRPTRSDPAPARWTWSTLGELALSMRYGTSVKCERAAKGAAVLRIPNVSSGVIDLDDLKFGPLSEREQKDLALEAGDLLMIRSNGSLAIVGRSAVVTEAAAGMTFAGYLVRVRLLHGEINSRYLWLALNSTDTRDAIEIPIRSAVGLKNVNLTEFGALPVPLPPLAEQHRIVAKVDELMALCDGLEASITTAEHTRCRLLEAVLHNVLEPA